MSTISDRELTEIMNNIHALVSVRMMKPGCERDYAAGERILQDRLITKITQNGYFHHFSINENSLDMFRALAKAYNDELSRQRGNKC